MDILITISTILLAFLTGIYVILTYKLLSESKRANELNQEAFRSQFQIATYPHLASDIVLNNDSPILSIQNLGTLPAIDVDILVLGLYSEDVIKIAEFIKSYTNRLAIVDRLKNNNDGFYGVYDHICYSIVPQQKKVFVKLSFPTVPAQLLILQQFRDIVGVNYYRVFWYFSDLFESKINQYRLGNMSPIKIVQTARIKFDKDLVLRTEDGSNLPEDVRAEFGMYWESSIPCGHTIGGYVGVEDRGTWSNT